jgi:Na+/proline symporter
MGETDMVKFLFLVFGVWFLVFSLINLFRVLSRSFTAYHPEEKGQSSNVIEKPDD